MGGIKTNAKVIFGCNLRKTQLKHGECYFVPLDDYIATKAGVILPPNFIEYAIL